MSSRHTMFLTSAICACVVLLGPVPAHAALNPVVMEDWSAEIGLADLEGPTYTAGWLDVDLDGDDEPIWLRSDGLYYLNHDADGKVALQQATVEAQGKHAFYARLIQRFLNTLNHSFPTLSFLTITLLVLLYLIL